MEDGRCFFPWGWGWSFSPDFEVDISCELFSLWKRHLSLRMRLMLFSRILRYFSISSLDFRPEEPFLSVFLIKRLFFWHPLWSLQANETLLLIGGEKDFLFPIAVESLLMSSSGPGSLLEVTRKLNGNWFIYVPWHYFCEFIYFLMTDVYIFFLCVKIFLKAYHYWQFVLTKSTMGLSSHYF